MLFDGRGRECSALVLAVAHGEVLVHVGEPRVADREPLLRLELAVALPKGNRAEWLFEHGTEVGVQAFRPVVCARSQELGSSRTERWRRIVAAAAAQCDRARVPEVHEPIAVGKLLARTDLPAQRWIGVREGEAAPRGTTGSGLLLVGPEGGFTPEESAAALAAGFRALSFSVLTWRTETAAVVGAALLL